MARRDGLTTAQRGYGRAHVRARAAAAALHDPFDPCARCGHPLGPMGPGLHYDHTDDRVGYLGFSHGGRAPCPVCGLRCNERAALLAALASSSVTPLELRAVTPLRW